MCMYTFTYRFKVFCLLAYCLLYATCTPAQTTDSLRVQKADSLLEQSSLETPRNRFIEFDSLHYRFSGDGNFTRGNVNRSLMVLRGEISYNGPIVSLTTNPRYAYGRQNGVQAERDSYLDLFLDIYKQKRVYGFGLATLEISNLRGIDIRRLAGAGVGFRLVQNRDNNVSLTNAVIHEYTDFRERPTAVTLRNSTRLKGRHAFLQNRIRFNHLTFFQPSLNNFSNIRWNTVLSLELPLSKWFSVRTSFENTYESVVDETRKNNDTRFTFGVSVGNK